MHTTELGQNGFTFEWRGAAMETSAAEESLCDAVGELRVIPVEETPSSSSSATTYWA